MPTTVRLNDEVRTRMLYTCETWLRGIANFEEVIDYFINHTPYMQQSEFHLNTMLNDFQFFLKGFVAAYEI